MTFVLAFVVIALGLVFLNRTAMLLGSPVTAQSIQAAVFGTHAPVGSGSEPSYATGDDGVVEVRLSVAGARFTPSDLQIPAGKPVRLIVDRPDANACSKQLVLPGLGIKRDLPDNGTATIDLPATDADTFTMTCGMGMMSGRLIVGGGGGGSGGFPGWVWAVVMVVAVAGAIYLALGLRRPPRLATEGAPAARAPSPAGTKKQAARNVKGPHPPSRTKKKGARR